MLSPADTALVQREPTILGMATLLDPAALVATIRRACPAVDLRAAQATYVRYKPRTSLLVAYELQVAQETLLVYGTAYTAESNGKLAKVEQWQAVLTPLGYGCLAFAEQALVIYPFPLDRKLTVLPKLADTQARKRLLRALLPAKQWRDSAWTHLRYKPERRYVAHLASAAGQALLKFYTPADYANASRSAQHFTSTGSLRIPQQYGKADDQHAQALEWLPGCPLDQQLYQATTDVTALPAVGAALAQLHEQAPAALCYYDSAAEVAGTTAAAAAIAAVCPHLAARADTLAGRLAAAFAQAHFIPQAIHGDFSADQVLLLPDGAVAILDLDNAGIGDPMADLGAFAAQMHYDTLAGLLSQPALSAAMSGLLTGYQQTAPGCLDRERLDTHTAARLLRLAVEPFRKREADWASRIATLLQRAETIANEIPVNF